MKISWSYVCFQRIVTKLFITNNSIARLSLIYFVKIQEITIVKIKAVQIWIFYSMVHQAQQERVIIISTERARQVHLSIQWQTLTKTLKMNQKTCLMFPTMTMIIICQHLKNHLIKSLALIANNAWTLFKPCKQIIRKSPRVFVLKNGLIKWC